MNWKSWPYWVKGTVLAFLFGLGLYLTLLVENWAETDWAIYVLTPIVYFPLKISESMTPLFCTPPSGDPLLACFGPEMLIGFSSLFLEFLISGAVIGYLYGKFKNRRKMLIS